MTLYYFKNKRNRFQCGFSLKPKSTTTNLVSYLDYTITLICFCNADLMLFALTLIFFTSVQIQCVRAVWWLGTWLCSYITNRYPFVRIHSLYSTPLYVLFGVPQGPVLGSLLFVFINDIWNSIKHSRYFYFPADIKIVLTKTSATDCVLFQTDINPIRCWYAANFTKLNNDETKIINFTTKINAINYIYNLCDIITNPNNSLKI